MTSATGTLATLTFLPRLLDRHRDFFLSARLLEAERERFRDRDFLRAGDEDFLELRLPRAADGDLLAFFLRLLRELERDRLLFFFAPRERDLEAELFRDFLFPRLEDERERDRRLPLDDFLRDLDLRGVLPPDSESDRPSDSPRASAWSGEASPGCSASSTSSASSSCHCFFFSPPPLPRAPGPLVAKGLRPNMKNQDTHTNVQK